MMEVYAVLKYIILNAKNLNIDEERISVIGKDGGGYLASTLAMELS